VDTWWVYVLYIKSGGVKLSVLSKAGREAASRCSARRIRYIAHMLARNIRIEEDLIDLARPRGQQLAATVVLHD
jgi:hypothetical protein